MLDTLSKSQHSNKYDIMTKVFFVEKLYKSLLGSHPQNNQKKN